MVKWGEQIAKSSSSNLFFRSSDYVRYAEIVAPIEAERETYKNTSESNLNSSQGRRQESIFGLTKLKIEDEMTKVESICIERLAHLQHSIDGKK